MAPTKHLHASLGSPSRSSSSSKPCSKQIDHLEKVRQDSLLELGQRIHEGWRKEPKRAWHHSGNKDGDEEVVQMIQKEFAPDAKVKGRRIPKPSKFHANILRIGAWQWTSRYNGDLLAKFYYANRRMIWEIVNEGLKMKIEIDWENVAALKVTCPEGGTGTLEIMLSKRPRFLKETYQQRGRNTARLSTIDFTGGQATIHSTIHIVSVFPLSTEACPAVCTMDIEEAHFDTYPVTILPMSASTNVDWRNHDGSQDSMPTLTQTSGAPSGGPQQHRNMFNHSNSSLQTHPQNAYFEQWHSVPKVTGISSTQDLYRSCEFEGQHFEDPMSIGANAVGGNHYGSQDAMHSQIPSSGAPSGGLQHRDMLNISSGRIMNETTNNMVHPRKRRNLLTRMGTSADSQVRPEDVRKFVKDIFRSAKRPANDPWVQQDYSVGSSSLNPMELELNHCGFQQHYHQTFEQINSATLPGNGSDATAAATVLERISHDLLDDDIDMEPTGVAEHSMIMSAVNSLSNLLQQDPAPATVQSSEASYAAAAPNVSAELATHSKSKVLVVAPDAGSSGIGGGSGNCLLPSTLMEDVPGELEPMEVIEMDLEYLSKLLPFAHDKKIYIGRVRRSCLSVRRSRQHS
ncbi:hypothetical protein C2845_PM13G08820 [Panicum miliaceum]|uniref:TRF2/HOY1 PH-like domain-containing protein n=1 Tax=Panicum miliaceum TaxID=4540 RepID=A0A3L6RFK4_PANMI|nr:hypothetical protein C2845_PM13G08820 [Panicum miliaceum]